MLGEWTGFWGLVLLSVFCTSPRRQGALFCLLCFCRSCLCALTCLLASAALWQAPSVLIDGLQQLRILDQPETLWNSWIKYQDLTALPAAALSKINGASLRKPQQYVQQTGENHSLTYLQDEELDERAFCSSYSNCIQVIESATHTQEARDSPGINTYCRSCKLLQEEGLLRKLRGILHLVWIPASGVLQVR